MYFRQGLSQARVFWLRGELEGDLPEDQHAGGEGRTRLLRGIQNKGKAGTAQ